MNMNVFIYDYFVNQKKYERELVRIETRLTDLGLGGKIVRMDMMNKIYDVMDSELRRGAKTIVVIGNDLTVAGVINAMATLNKISVGRGVPIGIIPIEMDNNNIAKSLGIDYGESACNTILARRIEKLDLGVANDSFFLSNAKITNKGTVIRIEDGYSIEALEDGEIKIYNFSFDGEGLPPNTSSNPQDGILEMMVNIKTKQKFQFLKSNEHGESFFSIKNVTMYNEGEPLILDDSLAIKCPAEIFVYPKAIDLIVGKNRGF
jgi:hypothetical protein